MTESSAEIAQLEHELAILRSRHAIMERSIRVLKVFFAALVPLLAITVAALIIYAFIDIVVGLFIVGISAVVAILSWIGRDTESPRAALPRPLRWSDKVSFPVGLSSGAWLSFNPRSEVEIIEEMIALREERLTELNRAPS
jgi:hypothetical protein